MDARDLIYMDNAATTWPKPPSVYDFMNEFYRNNGVNPGRSGFDAAISAGDLVEQTRARLARFFGGDSPERCVFCHNATDGLNLVIHGLIRPGDHIISTMLDHNSVLRPLNTLERDGRAEVSWLAPDEAGFITPEALRDALRDDTRLVVLNHGSNVIGTVQDIVALGAVLADHPALFVIDASQTAGVVPIDMREAHVDVLVATGHKALMGPTGTGVIVVRDHVEITATRSGGTGVRSAYPFHLDEYPWRLEFGTPNLMGIAGLWAGQEWIESEGGPAAIHHREMELVGRFLDGIRDLPRLTTYCCESLDNHLATFSLNFNELDAMNAGIMLDVDWDIATRTGLQCAPKCHEAIGTMDLHGTVRFSLGPFNTSAQIDKAIEAVRDIAG